GRVTGHNRFLIDRHWRQMESLENQMRQFEEEIAERMKPTAEEIARMRESLPAEAPLPPSPREEAIRLWMELPGVGLTTACSMVAELGVNMEQFLAFVNLIWPLLML